MNKLVFTLGLLVLIAASNCGDDDDEGGAGTGGGAGTSAGTGADDAGGKDAGGKDAGGQDAASQDAGGQDAGDGAIASVMCADDGSGACQNATDCPLVEDGSARETASSCGIGCLGDADEAACSQTCLVDETGITDACAECYVGIVTCSRDNCLSDCVADPDSADCFECQVQAGCRETFDDCSGLPPPQ